MIRRSYIPRQSVFTLVQRVFISLLSRLSRAARLFCSLALMSLATVGGVANAQDETGPLSGTWEYRKVSLHVEFKNDVAESDNPNEPIKQYAVITRSDWSVHRVGRKLYQNIVNVGKKRWVGEEIDDNGKIRKVRLRLLGDGKLHTVSYLDGRKDIQWTANES